MKRQLLLVMCAAGLTACATTYPPATAGLDQFAALELCPADGRLITALGSYTILECGYKPDEYAIARDGRVLEVIGPEMYVMRTAQIVCPEIDATPEACLDGVRMFVSERQAIKASFAQQQAQQRAQEFSAGLMAAGAALQAMDPVPSNPVSSSSLGPRPSMMTGFLTSQYTHGTMRTCVYNVGGQTARRTIQSVEMCPLNW